MKEKRLKIVYCGGVMSKTEFFKDVTANMMRFYMPDKIFAKYVKEKDDKKRSALFKKHAKDVIS